MAPMLEGRDLCVSISHHKSESRVEKRFVHTSFWTNLAHEEHAL